MMGGSSMDITDTTVSISSNTTSLHDAAVIINNDGVDDDDGFFYRHHGRSGGGGGGKHSSYSSYYPHAGNSTLNTSITIHVTPEHYHLISWSVLWGCFILAIAFAAVQVHYENEWFKEVAAKDQDGGGGDNRSNKKKQASSTYGTEFATRDGRPIRIIGGMGNNARRSNARYDVESSAGGSLSTNSNGSDAEVSISTADWTRRKFRLLLLLAMISRTIMIPIQIYINPIWVQLLADTFPVMVFASAWTLLVSFFVKLVGVALGATGIGDSDIPQQNRQNDGTTGAGPVQVGTVIQLTAYVLYILLMGTFVMNHVAAVLLYAFLSCIYAALLGTSLYFCPRLLTLLYPTLSSMMNTNAGSPGNVLGQSTPSTGNLRSAGESGKESGSSSSSGSGGGGSSDSNQRKKKSKYSALAMRLALCGILCVVIFAARTVGFCRKIVSPDHAASWWWQYGCLELFPAVIFLILIKPKSSSRKKPSDVDPSKAGGSRSQGSSKSPPPPSFATSQRQQARQQSQQLFRSNSYGAGGGGGNSRRGENAPLLKSTGGYGSASGISSGPPSPSVTH